jgi:hypothetical protein
MSAPQRAAGALIGALALAALGAGCGTRPAASTTVTTAPPAPPPLATSFAGPAGAGWAIVDMGGSAAQDDNFWQMFYRQASTWRLATPSGVADNGGLVVTGTGAGSLLTGFVPSQDLTFSPVAASTDSGASWSAASPVNPGLASVPDALAAGPGDRLIALTSGGAELGQRLGATWTHLASTRSLAATRAAQACQVTSLTAAAFSAAGAPMLASSCGRPGVAGIFADTGGTWHAAGPRLPASLARQDIDVLRLAAVGPGLVALLRAGTSGSITAAWYDGGRWTLSAPVSGGTVRSTAVGPDGSIGIILNGSHGVTLAGPGGSWHPLPALPKWTATLALGPSGRVDAIAAHGATFSDYRLAASAAASSAAATSAAASSAEWSLVQTIKVNIPYGSSS